MSKIVLQNVDKFYGKNHVLKDLNLTINDGEFMTLLGPSGCGKTTTLRVVSGLEKPQNGFIYMDDKEIVNAKEAKFAPPSQRNLNLVFQSYALWPHMTVFDNVSFGLKIRKESSDVIAKKVASALERMQIGEYAKRYPTELSGGQQQRVAIARAIVSEPRLLLLDEPLSNLDAKLRVDMRSELKRLHHDTGTTIIYVTHDQVEALTMSTRIALFRKGELVQVAPPLELYDNPVNLYTADFIGNPSINFVKGTAEVDGAGMKVTSSMGQVGFERADMTESAPQSGSLAVTLGIRPEQLTISTERDDAHQIEGRVYSGMPAGSETLVSVRVGEDLLTVKELGSTHYSGDQVVYLGYNPKKVNVFATESENLIKYCV
ncbi:MAG: ABC transporter ATP-binding protein [Oscillibacter sp.]|nr:ABC transporter ATP-binding protein [Oscillibacter sp.]